MTVTEALGSWIDCARAGARRVTALVDELLAVAWRPDGHHPAPPGSAAAASGPSQAEIEEAKYYLGPKPSTPRLDREPGDLPRAYGRDRIVLLPRDPWWAFAYWEITPSTRLLALRALGAEGEGAREVLRVYDVTFLSFTGDNAWLSFDLELPPGTDNWYLNPSRPAASYLVEIGLRTAAGRFLPLARSNMVTLPRPSPSPDTKLRWARLSRHAPPIESTVAWGGHRLGPPAGPSGDGAPTPGAEPRSSDVHTLGPSIR